VFRFWMDKGVNGFRLDVFNMYFKDESLRDSPPKLGLRGFDRQKQIYDTSQPEMFPLLKEIREILDQYPQSYAVGETFLADPQQTAAYCGEDKLHAAFNFDFAENRWHPKRFLDSAVNWYQALPEDAWPNNFLSNHDYPRTATRYCFGEDDRRAKVAMALLLMLKATPFMYYGEEIGLRDIPIRRKSDVKDPIGKTFWPLYEGRDGCRAPMQWHSGINVGFSQAEPWLSVHANFPHRNVVQQLSDTESLLTFVKKLIQIRCAEPALQRGDFTPLIEEPRRLLAFKRRYAEEQVLVLLNFSSWGLEFQTPTGNWISLFDRENTIPRTISLAPYAVEIQKLEI